MKNEILHPLIDSVAVFDPELVLLGGEMLHLLGDSFVEALVLEIPKSATYLQACADIASRPSTNPRSES